jgi:hypothetical protein
VVSVSSHREQISAFARTGAVPVVVPFARPGSDARASMLATLRSFP